MNLGLYADKLEPAAIEKALTKKIINRVKSDFPNVATTDIKVVIKNQNNLKKLPETARSYKINLAKFKNLIGGTIIPIMLYNKEEKYLGKKSLFIRTTAATNYLITTNIIKSEETFSTKNTVIKKLDMEKKPTNYVKSFATLSHKISTSTIGKDTIILDWMVKKKPIITKGQIINMHLKETNIVLKFKGEALSEGAKGDIIKAKGLTYKKILKGEIIDTENIQIIFSNLCFFVFGQ